MSYPFGHFDGEQLSVLEADGLYNAFPGVMIYGDRVAKRLPDLAAFDADRDMVSPGSILRQHNNRERLPGIRDALYEEHPIAAQLHSALARNAAAVPEPDNEIATVLEELGCSRANGILSYHGVPVPVGPAQIAYFMALRFRPLFSPLTDVARVYRGDLAYDAAYVTDEMQESILLVSTRLYRDCLTLVQQTEPALFLAMWMRQAQRVETLCAAAPLDNLPPCYPRSRLNNQRKCLMIVSDVMSEWERGFDLFDALRFDGGVTRASVRAALSASTSLAQVHNTANGTHRHITGAFAHMRSIHGTMNAHGRPFTGDPALAVTVQAFESSKVYDKQYRHVVHVAGDMPVRFFLGVEPMYLLAVILIQMRDSMERHEGQFWTGARGRQDACKGLFGTRLMSLAIIATSNICLPSARALAQDDRLRRDSIWIQEELVPLISNPAMREELEKIAGREDNNKLHDVAVTRAAPPSRVCGDKERFKSSYGGAVRRASLCAAKIGEPGWTMGFRPDAWRQPNAEVAFLRKCCRYTQFSQELRDSADRWNRYIEASEPIGRPPRHAGQIRTGLPAYHPRMRIEDLFRRWFNPLQCADGVREAMEADEWHYRETFVQEIAPMLPALTAITDDPQMNERFWVNRKAARIRLAVQGAWNIQ